MADLVRLPSVLTVPGDVLLGAAWSGAPWSPARSPAARHRAAGCRALRPLAPRSLARLAPARRLAPGPLPLRAMAPARLAGLIGASSCLYLGGMALNDYADRDVDRLHRPSRAIPSGRVTPRFAFGLAVGLTAGGLGLAAAAGGRSSLRVAGPLAAAAWAYDLLLKDRAVGPMVMAGCRFLDVLMGTPAVGKALLPATVVGSHTLVVAMVSRRETEGAPARLAHGALAGTAAVAVGAGWLAACRSRGRAGLTLGLALHGVYASSLLRAGLRGARDPSPPRLQAMVGTGVLGLMLLEAGLLSAAGAIVPAVLVAAAWPLARRLAARRSVT